MNILQQFTQRKQTEMGGHVLFSFAYNMDNRKSSLFFMSVRDDERSNLKLQEVKYASEIRRISNNRARKGQ